MSVRVERGGEDPSVESGRRGGPQWHDHRLTEAGWRMEPPPSSDSLFPSSPPTATSSDQTRNCCSLHTTHIRFASQRWHDLGTMPSNKVQYQCYFVCTRRQQKNSFCENISRPCPVLPHAVQLGWGRDCFRVYPLSTIYISTQYLPCP